MNIYHIILFSNIIYILKYFYQLNISKHYQQIINYKDELLKIENNIITELYNVITTSDNDIFEYEFKINCYLLNNSKCDEYILSKFNMTLNEQEDHIIKYIYYYLNNITIIKKHNNNCCNTYQLYWK